MGSAIAKREQRPHVTIPPTGLLLSIGDITQSRGGRDIPTRIDHFRPKEGQLEQYADAAAKFADVYGPDPKELDDLFFLSNHIGDLLDIRLMAWGSSGIRLRGDTNYATLPRDEWEERAFAFDDGVTFYPLDVKEVRREIRDTWNGEPILDQLTGPADARIEKLQIHVECTLTFCLPKVMGFGTVAKITTKSRRSMRNLMSSLLDQSAFFNGQLIGIPFRLKVRPAKTRRFDSEKRAYVPVQFFELVLDTPFTVQEALEAVKERRLALGGSPLALPAADRAAESRAIEQMLELPAGSDDTATQQLRDEPAPETVDDARLNRIARLEEQAGADGVRAILVGVFGVESAEDLSPEDAERYEQVLDRTVSADVEHVANEDVSIEDDVSPFERMANEAQQRAEERS